MQQWIAPWLLLEGQLSNHRCLQAKSEGTASSGFIGYRFEPDTSLEKTKRLYDTTFTLWINTSSGLPDHIEFFLPASDNPSAGSWVSRYFRQFEVANGVQLPRVEELVLNGTVTTRLQFDSVEWMERLPVSLFAELQGGAQ